ncbi:MAG: hypothetical protein WCY94_00930, partial [Synergistaceae bacterium]
MKRVISVLIMMLLFETSLFAADKTVTVALPVQADIGQPFLVSIRSGSSLQDVSVSWQGKD